MQSKRFLLNIQNSGDRNLKKKRIQLFPILFFFWDSSFIHLTDKASLLAKVVQRVRELKQQTSEIMQLECFPSEVDEISVMLNDNSTDGKLLIKASLCCEDRSDLIPDLNEILKSFHLSPLKAEIVTLGGRVRNVIILAGDKSQTDDESVPSLRDALRSLVQRSNHASGDRPKRRRVFDQGIVS
ncbi:unnamed protein product [Coffea canephora]|uniref:ACT domain-containing protein n=1 Tax=Coffea canephora TaxID=49390 RepID=A0A068UCE5_COFCA|nr:unnamed protein product [Coffea canephora]